jgi:hypothetical protein
MWEKLAAAPALAARCGKQVWQTRIGRHKVVGKLTESGDGTRKRVPHSAYNSKQWTC